MMPINKEILFQYQAAVKHGALIDRSQRGKVEVSEKDRTAFLHRMLTNDVQNLSGGNGCYACLLTAQAKIISDMNVFVFNDFLLLDVEENFESKLIRALEKFIITDDVKL
ncbi:MAG: hypothetical protein HY582_02840, partial [Candidatus Omnitrophica bacterium]|nr:hypothetical protein [Candidatus Omnitrophota bacterium]